MLIKNLLYILQSENYNPARFLKYAYSHFRWWDLEKRQGLKRTEKARVIYFVILFLLTAILIASFFNFGFTGLFLASVVVVILLPIIILAALLAIKPADFFLKRKIINSAKNILSGKKAIIVGIAGSYGKTSAKEILSAILTEKFKVAKTPENINTDLGIAKFILRELKDQDIFIVEMGAHYPGDIAKICKITNPSYSILTGINESHLERFENLSEIVKEKFSLSQKTRVFSILNFDDENIKENYKNFNIRDFAGVSRNNAGNIEFLDNFRGIKFDYEGENFECGLLAGHNVALILMCVDIARKLGMNSEEIKKGVEKIKPIDHRLNPIYNPVSNIRVIDDSYNGNFNGFKSGLEVLQRAKGRRVILTPGIVELGKRSKLIHNKIGKLYARNADLVLLIKNRITNFIMEGMEKNNFKNYKVYNSTKEAHGDLKNILKSGDTILFQNDWTDNYF